jgi:hypothetical protein
MYLILDVNHLIVFEVHLKKIFFFLDIIFYVNKNILPRVLPRICEHLTRVIVDFFFEKKNESEIE